MVFVLKNRILVICIGIISIFAVTLSGYKILVWLVENNTIRKITNNIENILDLEEVSEEELNVESFVEIDYSKISFLKANFDNLKRINNETVGFIDVSGTNISYPVVQTDNNNFYLNHTYDKSKNSAGWVFMDYRNSFSRIQANTILYAHARKDRTMFGDLKSVFDNKWLEASDNHYVRVMTPDFTSVWEVFSIYRMNEVDSSYLKNEFQSISARESFYIELANKSIFDFGVSIDAEDKILTLSTCDSVKERIVLHARLMKIAYF